MKRRTRRLPYVRNLLSQIKSPDDVKQLTSTELTELVGQIRDHLITSVSQTGGHLGPNLGVIELTIALHRVFSSPHDSIVYDTGHQSYVHKLLTGRHDFSTLRSRGGYAGYPNRSESEHDIVENSHASASLAWAHGIAKSHQLTGTTDRHTVAVIGDGALTGGMAWEALNNIAGDDAPVIIVVNDNERSYAPTIGGLASHLSTLRTTRGYEKFLQASKDALHKAGPAGRLAYDALHGVKKGLKDIVAPQGLFEDLGLKYIGPVDGHDLAATEKALEQAKGFDGSVIVHAITCKGNGYAPARNNQADQFHAVGVIDPTTGAPVKVSKPTWTGVFAEEMVKIADKNPKIVGITAAMLIPVGLHKFAETHPNRVLDVGIAEQHAVATAAGLAYGGLHPVVAVYSTFLNRAFDQVLMDVALHQEAVTLVLDRAGITGPDGPSHHGVWDLSLLQLTPGMRTAVPRDAQQLRDLLTEATTHTTPNALRFGKDTLPDDIPALERHGDMDIITKPKDADTVIIAVGTMVSTALAASKKLAAQGINCQVVDPRWVLPVADNILDLADQHRLVVTLEDGMRCSGVGARIAAGLRDRADTTPVMVMGVDDTFVEHGGRDLILAEQGLDAQSVARAVAERYAGLDDDVMNPTAGDSTTSTR